MFPIATMVLVTLVPMFAPMTMYTALSTPMASAPTMATAMDVLVELDCTSTVARIPMPHRPMGFKSLPSRSPEVRPATSRNPVLSTSRKKRKHHNSNTKKGRQNHLSQLTPESQYSTLYPCVSSFVGAWPSERMVPKEKNPMKYARNFGDGLYSLAFIHSSSFSLSASVSTSIFAVKIFLKDLAEKREKGPASMLCAPSFVVVMDSSKSTFFAYSLSNCSSFSAENGCGASTSPSSLFAPSKSVVSS
mmetsp:Transcript_7155/g.44414  ORF Transcript_7155/g.44414 Transcript_7155/m.44414 type:complete len:247 (+) Transcript_7155:2366-3106(+)